MVDDIPGFSGNVVSVSNVLSIMFYTTPNKQRLALRPPSNPNVMTVTSEMTKKSYRIQGKCCIQGQTEIPDDFGNTAVSGIVGVGNLSLGALLARLKAFQLP